MWDNMLPYWLDLFKMHKLGVFIGESCCKTFFCIIVFKKCLIF